MNLIDPSTPEGFFHLRLGPYKFRLIEEGKSFFPEGPDPEQASYFEDSTKSKDAGDGIESETVLLTAKGLLEKLRADWVADGEELLFEMTESLEALRHHVVINKAPDEEEGISDFVYPLF